MEAGLEGVAPDADAKSICGSSRPSTSGRAVVGGDVSKRPRRRLEKKRVGRGWGAEQKRVRGAKRGGAQERRSERMRGG